MYEEQKTRNELARLNAELQAQRSALVMIARVVISTLPNDAALPVALANASGYQGSSKEQQALAALAKAILSADAAPGTA